MWTSVSSCIVGKSNLGVLHSAHRARTLRPHRLHLPARENQRHYQDVCRRQSFLGACFVCSHGPWKSETLDLSF